MSKDIKHSAWVGEAIQAFVRIQTAIDMASWGAFMENILKESGENSKVIDSETVRLNIDVIRQINPMVQAEITVQEGVQHHHVSFQEFERLIKPYSEDKVRWWPDMFSSYQECQKWLNLNLKSN